MASRLLLVAHAATIGTRDLVFQDRSGLARPELVTAEAGRVLSWTCGPEPACRQTVALLGGEAEVVDELADADLGSWRGRPLAAVAEEDPAGLAAWMSDATAAPHGGESLAALMRRVGAYCDRREWPSGRSVLVVAPLVARAVVAHALAAGPEPIFHLDLAPLGRAGLSRQGQRWRLQQLG